MEAADRALIDAAVRLAVAGELDRSRLVQRESEEDLWAGTLREVQRLRVLTSRQAARIADLEEQLAQVQAELSRVELEDLVRSVTASIAETSGDLDGYAVSEATVDVRAAVRLAGGRMLLTADPAGLLKPDALSTVRISLQALPPPPGEQPPA